MGELLPVRTSSRSSNGANRERLNADAPPRTNSGVRCRRIVEQERGEDLCRSTVTTMTRLCERPGCSVPAAVAYGMENNRLLVWLEVVPDGVTPIRTGVLCRRHADAMVVPRGWTLDDRRESTPRLFRVADPPPGASLTANHPSRGRRERSVPDIEPPLQLVFDDSPGAEPESAAAPPALPEMPDGLTVGDIRPLGEPDADETRALPWRPVFDPNDDLGGLLKTSSPLLSRAFRGRSATPPEPASADPGDAG